MGLGRELQGIAHKLDPTPNKGKAGLGLGQNHPQEAFSVPKYSPQPDTAILTNDHAVLSFEEMEWWRIMEQRKPAKLLRSKFLPQDDILVALRSARELSQAWLAHLVVSNDSALSHQAISSEADALQKGGWQSPLREAGHLITGSTQDTPHSPGAASNSPGAATSASEAVAKCSEAVCKGPEGFCLHQGPCMAPHGGDSSSGFWQMASLDSAFSICSSLASSAGQNTHDSSAATLCALDLSFKDCGATEFVLSHSGVKVQSAQLIASKSAQKLMDSHSSADTTVYCSHNACSYDSSCSSRHDNTSSSITSKSSSNT